MAIGRKIAEKELGSKPSELLHKEAREKAKERVWNPEEEEILVREGGFHVNFFQLWKRHPIVLIGGIALSVLTFYLVKRSKKS